MDVTLVLATRADRPVLDRLLQLNEYDYSEWAGVDVDERGLFPSNDTEAIWRPDYRTYFIKVDGRLAGYAFVSRRRSKVEAADVNAIDEFFVMRKYRRQGVGERVARMLFDASPGRWEVDQLAGNAPAQAFWRRVIGRYTNGDYLEVVLDDARWRGPVQLFTAPER
jgi:predicted acetyltransferase